MKQNEFEEERKLIEKETGIKMSEECFCQLKKNLILSNQYTRELLGGVITRVVSYHGNICEVFVGNKNKHFVLYLKRIEKLSENKEKRLNEKFKHLKNMKVGTKFQLIED